MHLSTGAGECRDVVSKQHKLNCEADATTLAYVQYVIATEKPDFIAFTGDQMNGDSSPNAKSVFLLSDLANCRLCLNSRSCASIARSLMP